MSDLHQKNTSPKVFIKTPLAVFLGVTALVALVVVSKYTYFSTPTFQYVDKTTFTHGPRIDNESQQIDLTSSVSRALKSVFGRKSTSTRSRTEGVIMKTGESGTISSSSTATSTTGVTTASSSSTATNTTTGSGTTPVLVATVTNDTSPTSVAVSAAISPANAFGIAAGGSLTSMSQQELDTYFQALKNLGVAWVRWDIDWGVVQNEGPSSYDWSGPDRVATTVKKYGITSLGIITYGPNWANTSGCAAVAQCSPADPQLFSAFAGLAAERYKGTIDYWEVWNEPNTPQSGYPRPNVSQYATLLKATYSAIKKSNALATVVTGGLAAAADSGDGSIAPLTFIRGLYMNGAQNYFDGVALHPYSYPASPDFVANWNSWQQMNTIRDILVSQGDGPKKIWVTEYGAPTGGPGAAHSVDQLDFTYGSDYMSEAGQQTLITQVLGDYAGSKDWMGPFFWYSLHDSGTGASTPENFFGLLRSDWSKKPAYDTFFTAVHR